MAIQDSKVYVDGDIKTKLKSLAGKERPFVIAAKTKTDAVAILIDEKGNVTEADILEVAKAKNPKVTMKAHLDIGKASFASGVATIKVDDPEATVFGREAQKKLKDKLELAEKPIIVELEVEEVVDEVSSTVSKAEKLLEPKTPDPVGPSAAQLVAAKHEWSDALSEQELKIKSATNELAKVFASPPDGVDKGTVGAFAKGEFKNALDEYSNFANALTDAFSVAIKTAKDVKKKRAEASALGNAFDDLITAKDDLLGLCNTLDPIALSQFEESGFFTPTLSGVTELIILESMY